MLVSHSSNNSASPWIIMKPLAAGIIAITISACGGSGLGADSDDSDPLAVDKPVAYVKRPVPTGENMDIESDDIMEPDSFNSGAGLYIKSRSTPSAPEINITDAAFPNGALYDVKDVEVSYDGDTLLFSMRAPELEDVDEEDQPKWNIWEYNTNTRELQQVIQDSNRAEQEHDISPIYLPDGRILFTSTRQTRSRGILLGEGKAGYAATVDDEAVFNLHIFDPVNDPNGSNIQQITFNQGNDLQPLLLSDGRIAFLRQDIGEGQDSLSIYTINSDGSNLRLLYGYHSQDTGNTINDSDTTFVDFRELSDGSLSAILQARDSSQLGGDLIRIDTADFIDINQPTNGNSGSSGSGQRSLTAETVTLDDDKSFHGHFNSAYPLDDGSQRLLVSWNPCLTLRNPDNDETLPCTTANFNNPNLEPTAPSFGLWVYDTNEGTQVSVATAEEGQMYTDAIVMESRSLPPISAASPAVDEDLKGQGLAVLHIRSVYDTDGTDTVSTDTGGNFTDISNLADPNMSTADQRPARFLRLVKAVSMPSEDTLDFDNSAFGINAGRGMREILGYVPIEPDGSVKVQAPSDVAFYFDVVDANGVRTSPIHRNWLHLKAGETYECTGCHASNSELPHGRLDAEAPSVNFGGTQPGQPFPNTDPTLEVELIGETMAEVYARVNESARSLNTGMVYTDDWTHDPDARAGDPDYSLRYGGTLGDADFTGMSTPAPASSACQDSWRADCRTVTNYPEHIQPLWETLRPDGLGGDNQCVSCHSRTDAAGGLQSPDAQLELTKQPSTAEAMHFVSYRELFVRDALPFLVDPNGMQLDLYVYTRDVNGNIQFYLDDDGEQILDAGGQSIEMITLVVNANQAAGQQLRVQSFTGNVGDVYENGGIPIEDADGNDIIFTVPIDTGDLPNGPTMATSNSGGSRFFDVMSGSHTGYMSPNELRLLREWLDIGAQYYNNPFDAPLAD